MRKQVQNIDIRPPHRLVHIIYILRKSRQIDYSEIGTAGRPTVWDGFANVVETRPNELSADKAVVQNIVERLFVGAAPGDVIVVVGRAGERRLY